jgi:hypothetical protein
LAELSPTLRLARAVAELLLPGREVATDPGTSRLRGIDQPNAISGELPGRVGLSQFPAPGPELVAIGKACFHCQSKTESGNLGKSR